MKVIIIGGGIAGLSTALALQKVGISCRVYERSPQLEAVGSGIWMAPNAMKVLAWLGISEAILNSGVSLQRVDITNRHLKPFRNFIENNIANDNGHTITSIHRAALQDILLRHLANDDMLLLGKTYASHTAFSDRVEVSFADGSQEVCDVLLGADGLRSKVRQAIFPQAQLRFSGQTCWRGVADISLPIGLQNSCKEAWGREIRLGFSPISNNQVYWFAVQNAQVDGKDLSESAVKSALSWTYAGFAQPIPDILANTPANKIIRTDLYDLKRLDTWHQGRVCLIGDAAHATTPNMGQGGAQGVEDAYYISQLLASAASYKEAFELFEAKRRKKVDNIVNNSWLLGSMAHNRFWQPVATLAMRLTPENLLLKQMQEIYHIDEVV